MAAIGRQTSRTNHCKADDCQGRMQCLLIAPLCLQIGSLLLQHAKRGGQVHHSYQKPIKTARTSHISSFATKTT